MGFFLFFRLKLEYLQGILNGTVHEDNNHMRSKSKFFYNELVHGRLIFIAYALLIFKIV